MSKYILILCPPLFLDSMTSFLLVKLHLSVILQEGAWVVHSFCISKNIFILSLIINNNFSGYFWSAFEDNIQLYLKLLLC